MGPVLKILLGLYLFIWTVIGILIIAGGLILASKLPELKTSAGGLTQLLGGMGGASPNQNGQPPKFDPDVINCLKQELGQDALQHLGQGTQPTEKDQQAFKKCGFTPPTGASSQTGNSTTPQTDGTPPNDAQAGFPPK